MNDPDDMDTTDSERDPDAEAGADSTEGADAEGSSTSTKSASWSATFRERADSPPVSGKKDGTIWVEDMEITGPDDVQYTLTLQYQPRDGKPSPNSWQDVGQSKPVAGSGTQPEFKCSRGAGWYRFVLRPNQSLAAPAKVQGMVKAS